MWFNLLLEMFFGFLGGFHTDKTALEQPSDESLPLTIRADPQEDLNASWWE